MFTLPFEVPNPSTGSNRSFSEDEAGGSNNARKNSRDFSEAMNPSELDDFSDEGELPSSSENENKQRSVGGRSGRGSSARNRRFVNDEISDSDSESDSGPADFRSSFARGNSQGNSQTNGRGNAQGNGRGNGQANGRGNGQGNPRGPSPKASPRNNGGGKKSEKHASNIGKGLDKQWKDIIEESDEFSGSFGGALTGIRKVSEVTTNTDININAFGKYLAALEKAAGKVAN